MPGIKPSQWNVARISAAHRCVMTKTEEHSALPVIALTAPKLMITIKTYVRVRRHRVTAATALLAVQLGTARSAAFTRSAVKRKKLSAIVNGSKIM